MSDPGYDAQFQRGYSGPPIPEPTRAAPQSPVVRMSRVTLREADVRESDVREPDAREPDAREPHNLAPDAAAAEAAPVRDVIPAREAIDLGEVAPAQDDAPRRNPWSIALLVLSILLVLIGAWLLRSYATNADGGYTTPEQQTTALVQSEIAPVLLVGGIVGGIAWLLLGALGALGALGTIGTMRARDRD